MQKARLQARLSDEPIDDPPYIVGVPAAVVRETIFILASEFERRVQKKQIGEQVQKLEARIEQDTKQRFKTTEVRVDLDDAQYETLLDYCCRELSLSRAGIEAVRTFSRLLQRLCELLLQEENKQPLYEISGYKMKPYDLYTTTEMVERMKGELINLEFYTAWCRIQDPKAPEGERTVKHKIKILAPARGITDSAYSQRMAQIREQSYDRCYIPSEVVASELLERSKRFSPVVRQKAYQQPGRASYKVTKQEQDDKAPQRLAGLAGEDGHEARQDTEDPPRRHGSS